MSPGSIVLVHSMTVHARSKPDRTTRWLLGVIALGVVWLAVKPHALPRVAEAAREAAQVNVERVGGRYLTNSVIPVRCEGR